MQSKRRKARPPSACTCRQRRSRPVPWLCRVSKPCPTAFLRSRSRRARTRQRRWSGWA
jgi:hypothetical protein